MTEWFFEIRSGEIPALMQKPICEELNKVLSLILDRYNLRFEHIQTFVSPTRLGACVKGLAFVQSESQEERRGPRVDAPQAAVDGFLNSTGAELTQLEQRQTDKGNFYFFTAQRKRLATIDLLPEILDRIINQCTWPKTMVWNYGRVSWIRPITGGCSVFNGLPINYQLSLDTAERSEKIIFNNETIGHRFLSNRLITVSSFQEYCNALYENYIVIDQDHRKKMIVDQINQICARQNLVFEEDDQLLEEVTGLVEYPFIYLCNIDPQFMKLPPEVLKVSMRVHQRYFTLKDQQGNLSPHFLVVANIPGKDKGLKIRTGNERVLRARLSDANFFYANDLKITLNDHAKQLDTLIIHQKLGSFQQKTKRLKKFIELLEFGSTLMNDLNQIAKLAKADLVTEMVNEFPELQGIMGSYYAHSQGENSEVCQAIRDQYFSRNKLPSHDSGKLFALIDRIDTLVGFFRQGIQPTGSKDPFGLRRAAVDVIQLLENEIQIFNIPNEERKKEFFKIEKLIYISEQTYRDLKLESKEIYKESTQELGNFFRERLKIYWGDQGYDDDQIKAVLINNNDAISSGELDLLYRAKKRLDALKKFKAVHLQAYCNLLTIFRRVNNITTQNRQAYAQLELKKFAFNRNMNTDTFELKVYNKWFDDLNKKISDACIFGQYQEFLSLIAEYADDIHNFFDTFMINSEIEQQRFNRLHFVRSIYDQFDCFAKFDQLVT